jgi:hypothetical protein
MKPESFDGPLATLTSHEPAERLANASWATIPPPSRRPAQAIFAAGQQLFEQAAAYVRAHPSEFFRDG